MAISAGLVRPVAQLEAAGNPLIYNVPILVINTEQSQALTANVKQIMIKSRTPATIQLAFVSGQSGTLYVTVPPNCAFVQNEIKFTGTVYFQANKLCTIEILEWT